MRKLILILSLITLTTTAQARELTKQEKIEIQHELSVLYFKGLIPFERLKFYNEVYDLELNGNDTTDNTRRILMDIYKLEKERAK